MVTEKDKVDGVALTDDGKGIVLLLTDHLGWEQEYDHLMILQEKINAYISFLESGQYKGIFPDADVEYGLMDIRFLHDITPNCEKFLQIVQDNVGELGIKIECTVTGK